LVNNLGFTEVFLENIIAEKDIDSADVSKEGAFTMKATIEKSDFYKLRFSKEHYFLLVLEPGENITVELDMNNMYGPKISGSKNSELIYSTFSKIHEFDDEQQRLSIQIDKKKKDYLRSFILNNLTSLSSLFFIESLSVDEDADVYKKLDQSLSKLYPGNFMVGNLHSKIKSDGALSVGTEAPEIDLPGIDGKNIKLSSLRGKYVLIDFWASWCGPCRRESPDMVALYKENSKNNFEIFSVSLDQKKEDWLAAIKKDKLGEWKHVSDLLYWNSVAAKTYGVESIPFTVLLDKKGKIIAKGLRGEELKAKIKEVLQ
jgi:thiol-disulfide isomerase/thioredoxin